MYYGIFLFCLLLNSGHTTDDLYTGNTTITEDPPPASMNDFDANSTENTTTTDTTWTTSDAPTTDFDTNGTETTTTTSTTWTTSVAPTIEELQDDDNHTLSSDVCEKRNVEISMDYGYQLLVTVTHINLDSTFENYLMIQEAADENGGIIFTHSLKNERQFLIDSNQVLFKVNASENCTVSPSKEVFRLTYQRYGSPIITTTERPTTENPWPTPSPNDSIYTTVHVSGKALEDFRAEAVKLDLRRAVASMATEYCNTQLIQLVENITVDNVQIYEMRRCPFGWPDVSECVEVRFKLPVKWTGADSRYRLTSGELSIMYERHCSKYLELYGMKCYEVPNLDKALTWWHVVMVLILILSLVLIAFVALVKYKIVPCFDRENYQKANGRSSNLSDGSMVSSHTHTVPGLFDTSDGVEYEQIDEEMEMEIVPPKNRGKMGKDNLAFVSETDT